jgi:hypothetical protein
LTLNNVQKVNYCNNGGGGGGGAAAADDDGNANSNNATNKVNIGLWNRRYTVQLLTAS